MGLATDVWVQAVETYSREYETAHAPLQFAHRAYVNWIIGRVGDEDFSVRGPGVASWFLAAAHFNHRRRCEGKKPLRFRIGDRLPKECAG